LASERRCGGEQAEPAGDQQQPAGDRASHHRVVAGEGEVASSAGEDQQIRMGQVRPGLVEQVPDRLVDRDGQRGGKAGPSRGREGAAGAAPGEQQSDDQQQSEQHDAVLGVAGQCRVQPAGVPGERVDVEQQSVVEPT